MKVQLLLDRKYEAARFKCVVSKFKTKTDFVVNCA